MAHQNSQDLPIFVTNPTTVLDTAHGIIKTARAAQDAIVQSVPLEAACFFNVLLPLANAENEFNAVAYGLSFYRQVAPDPDLREASSQAQQMINNFHIETNLREDLYCLINAAANYDESLDPESRRYLQRKIKDYSRHGLTIQAGPQRERYNYIQKRIDQLCNDYRANLQKPKRAIEIQEAELNGVPHSIISEIRANMGQNADSAAALKVSLDPFYIGAILQYAENGETRKRCSFEYSNRCIENVPIFKEVVILRDEAARLLGYENHARFRLEDRMAKTPETVNTFLHDLRIRLELGGDRELERLTQFKREIFPSGPDKSILVNDELFMADLSFYKRLESEKLHSLDSNRVSEYFPLQLCLDGMLKVFAHLFGLNFQSFDYSVCGQTGKTHGKENVWHEDVRIFSVWDSAGSGDVFLGYIYMDLLAREGKREQDVNTNIQPGFLTSNGTRHHPATVLICNFQKPSGDKPILLRHSELVSLFHETGHAIHNVVSKTKYSRFHGTAVADDYGEAPSQLLEHWCWMPSILNRIGRHYSYIDSHHYDLWSKQAGSTAQPPELLPDSTIRSLISGKHTHAALSGLSDLHLSIFDMLVHQPETHQDIVDMDISSEYNKLYRQMVHVKDFSSFGLGNSWGHGYVNWTHPMNEYDVGYYGYLYAEVFADDIFHTVFKTDPMNSEEGIRYRRQVLEKGGSQDEMKTLSDFLGREPGTAAFYKEHGWQ